MRRVSFRSGLLAFIATAAITQIASAADLPAKAPMMYPAPVWNWTGLYVGVNAGYGVGWNRTTQTVGVPGASAVFTQDTLAPQGVVGGGQIGYNWQLSPNWLWGVEADFQGTGQKDSSCSLECSIFAIDASQKLPWFGTARLRVGYTQGDFLWYVTGGGAWAKIESDYSIAAGGLGLGVGGGGSFSETKGGFVVGAGVETHLAGNWSAKLEYLYMDLGTISDSYVITGNTFTVDSRIRDNIIRVGLNYKLTQ